MYEDITFSTLKYVKTPPALNTQKVIQVIINTYILIRIVLSPTYLINAFNDRKTYLKLDNCSKFSFFRFFF